MIRILIKRIFKNINEEELAMKSQSSEASICNSGEFQSPICIQPDCAMEMEDKGDIILNYDRTFLSINHNDKKLKICNDESGYAIINGRKFQLEEFHFHVGGKKEDENGSEHVIKGHCYKMELHLVHRSQVERIAAFSIFFEIGYENAALQTILELINKKDISTSSIDIDIKQLIPSETVYYHYLGSLTTGKCEENVEWYVFETPIEMSQEQLDIFKEYYHYSVRETQEMYGRKVLKKKVKLYY